MGIMEKLPIYTQKIPGGSVLLTATDKVFNWSRKSSIWYMLFGLACCAIEMMATGASDYDLDRLGLIFRGSPRQSDLMFIAGTVTLKMAPKIQTLYDQMAEPRYVIAMGNCACNGGPYYYDSYSTLKGVDRVIPVDIYVTGCPPRPEGLMYGIQELQKKIAKDSLAKILKSGAVKS